SPFGVQALARTESVQPEGRTPNPLRSPPANLRGMAVPAMTDLDRFLTGSSRAGRPCYRPFLAWLFRTARAEYVTYLRNHVLRARALSYFRRVLNFAARSWIEDGL